MTGLNKLKMLLTIPTDKYTSVTNDIEVANRLADTIKTQTGFSRICVCKYSNSLYILQGPAYDEQAIPLINKYQGRRVCSTYIDKSIKKWNLTIDDEHICMEFTKV